MEGLHKVLAPCSHHMGQLGTFQKKPPISPSGDVEHRSSWKKQESALPGLTTCQNKELGPGVTHRHLCGQGWHGSPAHARPARPAGPPQPAGPSRPPSW